MSYQSISLLMFSAGVLHIPTPSPIYELGSMKFILESLESLKTQVLQKIGGYFRAKNGLLFVGQFLFWMRSRSKDPF